MRRLLSLFVLLTLTWVAAGAQKLEPVFSTEAAPQYVRIQFKTGEAFLQDNGDGLSMRTALFAKNGQTFALIGNKDAFVLRSDKGNYVTMAADNTHIGATADKSKAIQLALIASPGHDGCYEITKSNEKNKGINQWGGAGAGKELGFWNAGDPNNPLYFVDPSFQPPVTYTAYRQQLPQNGRWEYPFTQIAAFTPESRHTLWYKKPAMGVSNPWMEYSLPIGNGSLGASLFGGVMNDEIQFNEKTLWAGGPNDINTRGGDGPNSGFGCFLNFGGVFVKNLNTDAFDGTANKKVLNYVRYLDIDKGIGGVNFADKDGTLYTRRYFASAPDGVVAARYTAQGANKLHLCFSLVPGDELHADNATYAADGTGTFNGKLQTIYHNALMKVIPVGGSLRATADGIEVDGASEVILLLCGGTSFDSSVPARTSGDAAQLADRVKGIVDAAAAKSWDELLNAHVANFTSFMGRVDFQITPNPSKKNTEDLVKFYSGSQNNKNSADGLFLEELYFHYGRYLEISSSRGAQHVPNNLQGIWNNSAHAPWNSDVHTNINVQMNYWPAEQTNLSECHVPFLDFIIDNSTSAAWRKAAQRSGQTKGWTVFTESSIFGGMSTWGSQYCVANAWYCTHLWDHYRYTLDKEYLKRAFPAMWSSAEFWMQRLKKDTRVKDGTWVCPNEWSPEHGPTEDGVAHAQQLVRANLQICRDAINELSAAELGLTPADVEQLDNYLDHIDTGLHTEAYDGTTWKQQADQRNIKKGDLLLREWKYSNFTSGQGPNHRHMSHLMCLFPLNQVRPGDGGYYDAAVRSLRFRGDVATGWSMGWKANLWARAKDGDHARVILNNALRHSTTYGVDEGQGGIYYNLYDSHAPFQIDGNFGMCSGIAQMLLQSQDNIIEILPALPSVWKNGHVTGLKAVGNFTVDITWVNGKPTATRIVSHKGAPLVVKSDKDLTTVYVHVGQKNLEVVPTATQGAYELKDVPAGATVEIEFTKPAGLGALKAAAPAASKAVYDLSGRRVSESAHGLQIVGGHKVLR